MTNEDIKSFTMYQTIKECFWTIITYCYQISTFFFLPQIVLAHGAVSSCPTRWSRQPQVYHWHGRTLDFWWPRWTSFQNLGQFVGYGLCSWEQFLSKRWPILECQSRGDHCSHRYTPCRLPRRNHSCHCRCGLWCCPLGCCCGACRVFSVAMPLIQSL